MNKVCLISLVCFLTACLCGDNAQEKQKNGSLEKIVKKITLNEVADNFYAVEPGKLYRSSQLFGEKLEQYIKTYDIKTIVNLRGVYKRAVWWKSEDDVCKKLGVNLYNIKMSSSRFPSKQQLTTLLDVYDTAELPILIHCMSGINRTGQAAALWVLEKQGGNQEDALEQFAEKYGYKEAFFPTKKFFIQEVWQGRVWLETEYDPKKITALYHKQKRKRS